MRSSTENIYRQKVYQVIDYISANPYKPLQPEGAMNDPYMPIEKELRLTHQALRIIANEKFPIHVITKSNLVEHEVDILQDISKTYAAVNFTITTADNSLSRKTEPHAPPTSERFKAVQLLADKGIYTGVTLMPDTPIYQ